ncbi:MAG: DinB family protein [Flavipsychrobacter sp.]|jgi:hypothetical protein|nr:DinB family protein [Flavipsychrobacter sp.]
MSPKLTFLLEDLPRLLTELDPSTPPAWGQMNVQQMVEHLTDAVLVAAGKIPVNLLTPENRLPQMVAFLFSEDPMPQNVKNPMMAETPAPVRYPDKETAIAELKRALETFQQAFAENPEREIMNPFFGPLNYNGQVQILYKHAKHHLKQFGV